MTWNEVMAVVDRLIAVTSPEGRPALVAQLSAKVAAAAAQTARLPASPPVDRLQRGRRRGFLIPRPPPPGAVYTDLAGVAGLLGVTVRRLWDLRKNPDFPEGRLIGGGGTLRFKIPEVVAWADRQPCSRYATTGGPRPSNFGRMARSG